MSVFKASALNLCALAQRYKQTSKKYEVYFNIFQSECSVFSGFSSKIHKKHQKGAVSCNLLSSQFKAQT